MKYLIFLLLLCSAPAIAQKSAQVAAYLGQDRYENEKPVGDVTFRFEKATLRRSGDGKKTFAALLTHAALYSDAQNAGALLGIQVAGKTVQPDGAAMSSGEVQPVPEKYGGPKKPGFWASMPDSSRLEQYKADMIAAKMEAGRELAPRQGFLMWVFHNFVLPILFVIGLLARFVAKSAFNESKHDLMGTVIFGRGIAEYGHTARYVLFGIGIVVCIIELANMAIADYFAYDSLWWWGVKAVIISFATYWVFTTWVVPNPRKETREMMIGSGRPGLNRG